MTGTITTDRTHLAESWVDAFLLGLSAAGVHEDRYAELLDQAMPQDVRQLLARKAAREHIQGLFDSGHLVRLADGLCIERADYDPEKHGPEVAR